METTHIEKTVKKTILLVEDEVVLAMVTKAELEHYGYSMITANSGEKAVTLVEANPSIDLILMDIDLGKGLDGTDTAAIVLRTRDIPVVFLSSHTEPEIVEKTERITSYGYVVKNSSITVLDASIKMAFKLFEAKVYAKEKEEHLRKNEKRYRESQEIGHIGSWELNLKTDTFWASDEGLRIYGLHSNTDSLNSELIRNCVVDRNRVNQALVDLIAENKPYNIIFDILPVNSTEKRTLNSIAELERDENGKPLKLTGIIRDITEQTKAHIELASEKSETEKRESYLTTILSAIGDIVVSRDRNNKVTFYNEAFDRATRKLFGVSASIGMNTLDYLSDAERAYWQNSLANVMNGIKNTREYEFTLPDGGTLLYRSSHVPMLHGLEIIGTLEITQDITESKLAEEKLRESEEKYRAIVENTSDYIMRYDREYRHIGANSMTLNANGLTLEEFCGKTHRELGYPEHLCDLWETHLEKVFETGISEKLSFGVTLEGTPKNLELLLSPEFDTDGKVRTVIGISRDMTERKQAELQILKLLDEKELILKEVHHRMKNNMNTICGILTLQINTLKNHDAIEALKDACRRVQSMMMLYDKLYQEADFRMMQAGNYMKPLIAEIISNFPNRDSVKIVYNIEEFSLSAKQLHPLGIIINELITNSMKYAFVGMTENRIEISASRAGNKVTLSVEDNGTGMPDSVTFENSTGFGIILVRNLSAQLDGTVRIERGQGTKIVLEFERQDLNPL